MKNKNQNIITEMYYHAPITYDKENISFEELTEKNQIVIRLLDKKSNTTIWSGVYPIIINQIKDNEFIIVFSDKTYLDYHYIFQHIEYDEEKQLSYIIYEKEYQSKNILGEITNRNELYILESYLKTTIYNYKTRKSLTLKDLEILPKTYYINGKEYLNGNIKVSKLENLTIIINTETLEFNEFYSRLQNRLIPIYQDDNNSFKKNYKNTVKHEIKKYLKLLKEIELEHQRFELEKATKTLRKHLGKRKEK